MRNTVLKEMDKCSGCGLCETVCPAQAIKMEYDKSGFIYPVIQKEKCIDCGLCERKCVVKTVSVEYPRTCYAGVHLDEKIRAKSSSGGMFAALAEYTLEQGGVVFGAAVVPKGKIATVYKGNIIKNLIMDCQSYTKYRPNETTGGIFVSWRRKEELPTGA